MGLISQSAATPVHEVIEMSGLSASQFYTRLLTIADRVSALLLEYYNGPERVTASRKPDQSPITDADKDAHALLVEHLGELTPPIPVLSEESSSADISGRLDWPVAWMVDPLDGTREFIDRTDEFTCNIALIIANRPVLGLISVPCKRFHYLGVPGAGCWRYGMYADTGRVALNTRQVDSAQPLVLLASVRHHSERVEAMMTALTDMAGGVERLNAGSAVKFCELLEGEADVYPRSSPCCEWDVAAGDALVTAAGGRVYDYQGKPLRYNCRETLLSEYFVAAADPTPDYWSRLVDVVGLSRNEQRS